MNDRLLALLDDLEAARIQLEAALTQLGEELRDREVVSRPDFRISEQNGPRGIELHESLIAALERMHHSMAAARAEGVRVLVDEEGLSVSQAAKRLNRPRQLVSRLYRSAAQTAPR
jgi:hypothetical protein